MFNSRIINKCILIVFVFLARSIFADIYYLNDLINHALENSSSILRSHNDILDKRDNHLSNYLDILPNVNYSASTSEPPGLNNQSSTFSIGKSFSLNEPTYFNIKRSIIDKQIADMNHEQRRKEIARDILFIYLDIIKREKNIQITEQTLQQRKQIYEQTYIQFNNGSKTIFDLQTAQLDTLDTHIQLQENYNSLSSDREKLFYLIKMEDKGYPLESVEFEILPQIFNDTDTNISIQILELNYEIKKSNLKQNFLSLFPSLSMGYSWSSNADDILSPFSNTSSGSGKFSINLSYPIFNHRSNIGYRMAKRSFSLDEIALLDEKERFSQEIQRMLNDLTRMNQTYELNKQRFELSLLNLRMAEERYILGVLSFLELNETRNRLLQTEFQLNDQFFSIIRKQEEINFAKSGKILGIW